ncbi:MAG: hypothetical protein AAGB31_13305 [Bdellovibrio sp.]
MNTCIETSPDIQSNKVWSDKFAAAQSLNLSQLPKARMAFFRENQTSSPAYPDILIVLDTSGLVPMGIADMFYDGKQNFSLTFDSIVSWLRGTKQNLLTLTSTIQDNGREDLQIYFEKNYLRLGLSRKKVSATIRRFDSWLIVQFKMVDMESNGKATQTSYFYGTAHIEKNLLPIR